MLGLSLVAIGNDDDLAAHIGNVGPGKAVHDRDREDALLAFKRATFVDEAAHWLARGVEDADGAAVEDTHHGPRPSLDRAGDEVEEILGAFGDVDMGILLEEHDGGGAVDLARADIGVEIELRTDGYAGSDDAPHGREQIALGVVVAFRHHRPMQREQHGVDRERGAEIGQDLVAEALIDLLYRLARWLREGAEAFRNLPSSHLAEPPPHRERCPEERHPLAIAALPEKAGVLEELQPRRQGGEGVGLGAEAGGEELGHAMPPYGVPGGAPQSRSISASAALWVASSRIGLTRLLQ